MDKGSALLLIDVQNDFCTGGALPVPTGDEVVPVLNRAIALFRHQDLPVIASRDWHPPKTSHFREFGGLWPVHCVAGTPGADFHPILQLPADTCIISKGMDPAKDDYSAFQAVTEQGTPLPVLLQELGITKLYVGGLATDYCVQETVLEGLKNGFAVILLRDGVRGVELSAGDSARAVADMIAAGAEVTTLAGISLL